MKKYLTHLLCFAILIAFSFFLINILQKFYNTDPAHYKLQYENVISQNDNTEGIILGTSHATHAIRPTILDQTGIHFYNYALDGANPKFYFNWYNELFKDKNPKYCIIAFDWFMFDDSWLWRNFEQDSEYFPFNVFYKLLRKTDKFNIEDLIVNRFPFIKYKKNIISSLKLKKGDIRFNPIDYDRGFIPFNIPFDSANYKSNLKYKINKSQLKIFKFLVAQMYTEGIEIIFVMIPEFGIKKNEYLKMQSIKIINEISQKYNIPILNFNTTLRSSINENIFDFSDWGHMNKKGSIIFPIY